MAKNLLLIQPHSDDILFSASRYIFERNKYKKVKVLTMEYNEKRLVEDANLFNAFEMQLIIPKIKVSSENWHKMYYTENTKMSDDTCMEFCERQIGKKQLKKLISEITALLEKHEGYEIVTCLGVGHPFHWLVNKITAEYANIFYRDFPHSYKKRNQEYFTESLQYYDLNFDYLKHHDKKFELIAEYYKSQKALLFFEKRYIDKKLPEEFYKIRK